MKTCVVTANFECNANKVWLYLSNPNLNHWRTDVKNVEISDDGMQQTENNNDGSVTQVVFSEKEKPRRIACTFSKGRVNGSFIGILLGGGEATSVECTMQIGGIGLFKKPQKLLEERMEMLRKALGQ